MTNLSKILKMLSFTEKMLKLTRIILFASLGIFGIRLFTTAAKFIKK